jgi:hypothetical protein
MTAVEWLLKQYVELGTLSKSIVEQAKEMEKEQIIQAYIEGDVNGIMDNEIRAEQYYNETYEKNI